MGRLRARFRADDGVSSIQHAVLYPVIMLLLLAVLQGGIYLHAQNVARGAANSAVQVARSGSGSVDSGQAEAAATLAQGGSAVRGSAVHVDRGPQVVTVTVTGSALSLIPGLNLSITQTATGPVERFVEVDR